MSTSSVLPTRLETAYPYLEICKFADLRIIAYIERTIQMRLFIRTIYRQFILLSLNVKFVMNLFQYHLRRSTANVPYLCAFLVPIQI
jgi:hypothetical protein